MLRSLSKLIYNNLISVKKVKNKFWKLINLSSLNAEVEWLPLRSSGSATLLKSSIFHFFVGGKYNTISVILNKNDPVQATDFQCCIRVPESESSLLYRTLWTWAQAAIPTSWWIFLISRFSPSPEKRIRTATSLHQSPLLAENGTTRWHGQSVGRYLGS